MITDKFTESEVRTAYLIGIATGHTIDEINAKIIAVTANNRSEAKKMPNGNTKMMPVDGSSKLSIALDTLRNAGYIR